MMLGIGIGITAGVGRSVSLFNRVHQELFGAGEQGIYMPSVHESFLRGDLYQDAAGTTPVTAVGQPVGLWSDRSANGNHPFQATAASRPALQQDANGMYVLRFDGVNDFLSVAYAPTAYPMTLIAGVEAAANHEAGALSVFEDQTEYKVIGRAAESDGYSWAAIDRGLSGFGKSLRAEASERVVLTGRYGDVVTARANGIAASGVTTNNAFGSPTTLFIGKTRETGIYLNGDIYGVIAVNAEKTLAQIELAESLINKYARAY